MDEQTNLLRILAGQLHSLLVLTIAREKFSKGFLELNAQDADDAVASAQAMTKLFAIQMNPAMVQKFLESEPPPKIQ
jgi:hypothetical protein